MPAVTPRRFCVSSVPDSGREPDRRVRQHPGRVGSRHVFLIFLLRLMAVPFRRSSGYRPGGP
jgi:hypothetical protein